MFDDALCNEYLQLARNGVGKAIQTFGIILIILED